MRKEMYRMDPAEAVALLERAPVVHFATTTATGEPLLRTVHGVVVGPFVAFHGAPAGEKTEAIGRTAVVSAEETVAQIPSYFVDAERACPATTYYLSVQVHGVLERVEDAEEKAAILRTLMTKFQPEGGHVPIDPSHPLYTKALLGLLIVRVPLERVDGKAKLGQNRTPTELARVVERLWERGGVGDANAVEYVLAANPGVPRPSFLAAPDGTRLVCALGEADVAAATGLLADANRLEGLARQTVGRALLASTAWVGARDASGALIATARAMSDGAMRAFVDDVCVAKGWRERGVENAVMRLLLDHPRVRSVRSAHARSGSEFVVAVEE
jgi:nitroimidazol reductase NimA-like FMN-containing flavoprotein (pyridoxamine 5'-phosphate oxidase superfamily)